MTALIANGPGEIHPEFITATITIQRAGHTPAVLSAIAELGRTDTRDYFVRR